MSICLQINPREHASVSAGSGLRIKAFHDATGASFAHFFLDDPLLGPVEKFQAKIANPKIRSGERLIDLRKVERFWQRGRIVRLDRKHVLVRFAIGRACTIMIWAGMSPLG